ncbi:Trk system potassium transporter TrkA [Salinibaculum rarum]|uniref:Trk system potassium transporter TrkA n=1 Tax=Salinibaculum rarum TaxID=3058903 RepID=UPI00265F6CE4|nr:Trk system potassium transporter TrkA [Salinibaculum sp. KK48]
MHIVIVGAGEVGSSIAKSLADSHDVVVVDVDPEKVEALNYNVDALAIEGDGASLPTLREAGIEKADILIASTDDDETNIITCGTAKTVADPFTIARIKGTNYLETWQGAEGALGVDFMVGTTMLTAKSIVRVIGLPAAHDVDTFAGGRVQMAEFEIPEASPVAGQTVQEADRFESLTFAAIFRNGDVIIPTGQTGIEAGDEVVVIGSEESVHELSAEVSQHTGDVDDILIVGGTEVACQIARLLEEQGLTPRLVEHDHDRARELAEELPNSRILEHDGTDREFLEREHIEEVDTVVAALKRNERNLLVSLLTKRLGVDRAVAIVDETEYSELFEAVGVDVAVSPREATAEEITRFTRERRAENVALIENDRAEVIEIEVDHDSVLADRPIQESIQDLPEGLVIGAITRNGDFVIPRGDTVIEEGDNVVVFAETVILEEATAKL